MHSKAFLAMQSLTHRRDNPLVGVVTWTATSIYYLMALLQLVKQAYRSLSLHAAEDAISTNNLQ
jgi:hypothetical protein